MKDKFIFSGFLFLLALLSKEASLAYPFVVTLFIYLFRKANKKAIYAVVVFFFISASYLILRFKMGFGYNLFASQEIPIVNRIIFLFTAIGKYLGLIFLPMNQHMSYTVNIPVWFFEKNVLLSLFSVVLIIFFFFYFMKKDKFISFFIGWFLIFLLPQSGIFSINALFAEHFVYLSSMGVFIIFIYCLRKIKPGYFFYLVFIGYTLFFSLATIKYNIVWQNEIEFYKRIVGLSKNSFTAFNNLGLLYLDKKDYDRSERMFIKSLEIKPDFEFARLNLAKLYSYKKDYKRAIGLAKGVIKENPNNYLAYNYLGNFYQENRELDLAKACFNKGLELNQDYLPLWADLYYFYKLRNNEEEAAKIRDYIAKVDKYYLAQVFFRESQDLFRKNKIDEALFCINEALEIDKKNISFYNLRGLIFKLNGDYVKSYLDFKVCLGFDSNSCEVYNNIGNLFAQAGDFKNAEANFKIAISLNANFTDSYFNLGLLYFENNKTREALEYFKKAIALNPDHKLAKEYLKKAENPQG
jgi:protein O-mannosyl-transferase